MDMVHEISDPGAGDGASVSGSLVAAGADAVMVIPPGMCGCEVCNGLCAKRLKVSESQFQC